MTRLISWLLSLLGRSRETPPSTVQAPHSPTTPQPSDTSRWERCSRWILDREGGFVINPHDPGGATNMGITIGTLSDHLGRPATVDDVQNMGVDVALAIYYHDYWHANRCDEMPPGVDLMMLDSLVMTNAARARKWLQAVLHVNQDGIIGPSTMQTLADFSRATVIMNLGQTRLNYYRTLPTWATFGGGWQARVQATTTAALTDAATGAVSSGS